ncbi:hypothetical protein GAQ43_19240, partial [Bacteroides uniformis]
GTFVSLKHNVKIINSLKNAWQSLISFACGNQGKYATGPSLKVSEKDTFFLLYCLLSIFSGKHL